MTRWPMLIAALSAAAGLATAAKAADADNVADVRCVVVAMGLTQSPDPQVKALAAAASLYFVGRIDGRAPDLDLEAMMIRQVNSMSMDDMRGELQRCAGILQTRGDRLKAIGADLQKIAGQAGAAPPPPATAK